MPGLSGIEECARCFMPATLLVVHPHLFRMAIPYCVFHRAVEAPHLEPIEFNSPEGQNVLATHTLLRGYVVPRQLG